MFSFVTIGDISLMIQVIKMFLCICSTINLVYSNNPDTIDDLKMVITEYIQNADRAILNSADRAVLNNADRAVLNSADRAVVNSADRAVLNPAYSSVVKR
jgi:hypothetical protein